MELCKKNDCTGCLSCYSVCKFNAIELIKNEKGFIYPTIDKEKCVNCGLCQKVVDSLNNDTDRRKTIEAYGVVSLDESIRSKSQSGGLAYLLSKKIIEKKGIVYGAAYTENFKVEHIRVETLDELDKLRGSKYVQSDLEKCLKLLIKDLKEGKIVLFIGTPCQISGIKSIVKVMGLSKNFYSVDFICHGVPSPKILEDYLFFIEKKYKKFIKKINLRNKKVGGWHNHLETIEFEDNNVLQNDLYKELFYSNLALRESCENCKYTKKDRTGDITIGDYWGVEKFHPEFYNDNKGISLALIQTLKGRNLFESLLSEIDFIKLKEDEYLQPQLLKSSKTPYQKNNFWKDYNNKSFEKILKKYTPYGGVLFKIKRKILNFLGKW